MNVTLKKFLYPSNLLREYSHWVLLIRPEQVTVGCVVIAAKTDAKSFGALGAEEMAEWPTVVRDFEQVVSKKFGAEKFNYLALMMVDPNPHFHGIPRYRGPVSFQGRTFTDERFPKPPALDVANACSAAEFEALRDDLKASFAALKS